MYSKIDATSFLKANDHLNDSIDRSLVNEYTNKTFIDIFFEILKGSFLIWAPFLSIFLMEITNILIFSYNENYETSMNFEYLWLYFLIQGFYYFFNFNFFFGAMKYYESFINYDKREIKLKSIFYNFTRIFYFLGTFLYQVPLSFFSYYFFSYFFKETLQLKIFEDFWANYIFYFPLIFYLNILFHLNLQILRHFFSFYYIFFSNIALYWLNLYAFSFIFHNKISLITYSLISSNLINLIISHFAIRRDVFYLKGISFFFYEEIFKLKFESFFTFVKYSSVKGLLFIFNFAWIYLIIFLAQFFNESSRNLNEGKSLGVLDRKKTNNFEQNFTFASIMAFILMALPNSFILSVAKYYKNYLEISVYDHSQNTKTKYLKFFWLIVIFFTTVFAIMIFLFNKIFFISLLNVNPLDNNGTNKDLKDLKDSNISEIFYVFNSVLKFYSVFIYFDSFGLSFQEIIKTFNDHSRNYLNFYKGVSLIFVFFPLGFILASFLNFEFFWGFWIGIYFHMILYAVILMFVNYRNYYTSTFQICY